MNNVSLFGEVDSAPELLGMPGRDVCQFWLKVSGRFEHHTLYVLVVSMRGLAERLAAELAQGDRVAISGHLRSERWPGPRRMYRHTVLARDVQGVGSAAPDRATEIGIED